MWTLYDTCSSSVTTSFVPLAGSIPPFHSVPHWEWCYTSCQWNKACSDRRRSCIIPTETRYTLKEDTVHYITRRSRRDNTKEHCIPSTPWKTSRPIVTTQMSSYCFCTFMWRTSWVANYIWKEDATKERFWTLMTCVCIATLSCLSRTDTVYALWDITKLCQKIFFCQSVKHI